MKALDAIPSSTWEIVYVVEGTDGTREELETLRSEVPTLRVLYEESPSGLGAAFRRGFAAISPDTEFVITMDADMNHRPEELGRLLESAIRRELDILIGSRFVKGGRIEGTPAWKLFLSGAMNVVMRFLWGLPVRDKTSGYRVYRASSLRRLQHRLDDFAFLPELLILAQRLGLTLGEEPIHFVYRIHGASKMAIFKTIRSYAALLRSRFDVWSTLSAVILLAGLGLRVFSTLPLHRWPTEPDALLTSMTALRILKGDAVVFYSGVRLGALESYIHAAVFAVVGASRGASTVAPLLCGALLLVMFLALSRRLLDRPASTLAFAAFALPGIGFLYWTIQPNGYPLLALLFVVVLFLADRLARGPSTARGALATGVACGLSFWASLQSLAVLLPALMWIAGHRGRGFLRPNRAGLLLGGILLGASPWLAFNVRYPLETFRSNFAVQPATDARTLVENNSYLLRYTLPELLASLDAEGGVNPPNRIQRLMRPIVLTIFGAGFLAAVYLASLWLTRRLRGSKEPFPPWFLLVLVAGTMWAMAVVSAAVALHGLNARYILPVFPVACICVGLLATVTRNALRYALFALCSGAFCLASLAGAPLPGTAFQLRQARAASEEQAAIRFLDREGLVTVWGDYWDVYSLSFLTAGRITGVPTLVGLDYYRYEDALPPGPARWALLARTQRFVRRWAAAAGIRGTVFSPNGGFEVFVPDREGSDARRPVRELSGRLRAAHAALGSPR